MPDAASSATSASLTGCGQGIGTASIYTRRAELAKPSKPLEKTEQAARKASERAQNQGFAFFSKSDASRKAFSACMISTLFFCTLIVLAVSSDWTTFWMD